MRQSVRVIVFNADGEYAAKIRSDLLRIPRVQIVAELDELALVEQAVAQFPAEILLVHLDPLPEVALPVAAQIARSNATLHVFVISEATDGQLILTAMRAGIREFFNKPIDPGMLTDAFDKVIAQTSSAVRAGTLISILGTIGGCGASSLAVNLGTELNDLLSRSRLPGGTGSARQAGPTDRGIVVVDLDFRYGQLGTMLDLQADYTLSDLCETPEQLDPAVIDKAMVKHSTGVHLLARPNTFKQADHITAANCSSVLSSLQQLYEYVVVDGPIRFDPGAMSVLDLADVSLLVIQLLVTSVRNVHRMLEELRDAGYNLNRFRLVCNRVGRDSGHLAIEHVENTLNMKVIHQIPDDWKTMSAAINIGVPLIECAPKSRVRASIRDLAEQLYRVVDDPAAAGPSGSLPSTAGSSTTPSENVAGKKFGLGRLFSRV